MSTPSIQAHQLVKKFGDFTAVKDLSLEVSPGEIFGFLGANGAGKTTAMRMLCGLLKPSFGHARVAGFDVATQTEHVKKNIGYMSQKFSIYDDLTLKENIQLFSSIYGLSSLQTQERMKQLAVQFGLEDKLKSLVSTLPLGWKQKLAFSIAVIHQPRIVFLDEPTSGVDPITRRQFWEMIFETANAGTTVFVTTHYMDEAEYCDRVSIMVEGQIQVLDTPQKIREQFSAQTMDDVFSLLARKKETPT
ncbi:MAG: ABC transporter ATP-binding protein [Cystobacterineae bacterium]|nr:ABC transporter ATP-binding protein [Cystobacterineae bacterium]